MGPADVKELQSFVNIDIHRGERRLIDGRERTQGQQRIKLRAIALVVHDAVAQTHGDSLDGGEHQGEITVLSMRLIDAINLHEGRVAQAGGRSGWRRRAPHPTVFWLGGILRTGPLMFPYPHHIVLSHTFAKTRMSGARHTGGIGWSSRVR